MISTAPGWDFLKCGRRDITVVLVEEKKFVDFFPRTMQDNTFISWHMGGYTWALTLTK
jgi:hypothetical protein